MGYIYNTRNNINGKEYIGSSKMDSNNNWSYYGSGTLIKNAIKKYGKLNFTKTILWEGEGDPRLVEGQILESLNAASNPQYYNMTNDAVGNSHHNSKIRLSISEKLTGRKLKDSTKTLISKNKTGIRFKDGYNMVVTTKPGTSKAHKGRISPNENKGNPIELYDNKTKQYISSYPNASRLAEELGITNETIRQCLKGITRTICSKQYYVKYEPIRK
tara:strand:- start:25 stop:672 length:648 start_codon:yes stop_codon:yes gene_type:complete